MGRAREARTACTSTSGRSRESCTSATGGSCPSTSPRGAPTSTASGFTFGGLTCHDHDGDWEGVTVELSLLTTRPQLGQVPVLQREARGGALRLAWQADPLEVGQRDAGRRRGHTPPIRSCSRHREPCLIPRRLCRQGMQPVVAGASSSEEASTDRRHGKYNDAARCADVRTAGEAERADFGVPAWWRSPRRRTAVSARSGTHSVGRWGKAECTLISRICTKIDGPRSPGRQLRFNDPTVSKRRRREEARRLLAELQVANRGRRAPLPAEAVASREPGSVEHGSGQLKPREAVMTGVATLGGGRLAWAVGALFIVGDDRGWGRASASKVVTGESASSSSRLSLRRSRRGSLLSGT